MHVLRVVGPSNSGKTTLVERLADRLSDRGRVGTVKHIDCQPDVDIEGKDTARHRAAGAAETHAVTIDGEWFATGTDRSLRAVLDRLATDCAYALVEGYGDAPLPTVRLGVIDSDAAESGDLGDSDASDDPLAVGETAEDVDVDAVIERLVTTRGYETRKSLVEQIRDRRRPRDAGDERIVTMAVRDASATTESDAALVKATIAEIAGIHAVAVHAQPALTPTEGDRLLVACATDRKDTFEAMAAAADRVADVTGSEIRTVGVRDGDTPTAGDGDSRRGAGDDEPVTNDATGFR